MLDVGLLDKLDGEKGIPDVLIGDGNKTLETCMGDLFSVAWMEDTEQEDPQEETLRVGEGNCSSLVALLLFVRACN